jgi:hypothetical protein
MKSIPALHVFEMNLPLSSPVLNCLQTYLDSWNQKRIDSLSHDTNRLSHYRWEISAQIRATSILLHFNLQINDIATEFLFDPQGRKQAVRESNVTELDKCWIKMRKQLSRKPICDAWNSDLIMVQIDLFCEIDQRKYVSFLDLEGIAREMFFQDLRSLSMNKWNFWNREGLSFEVSTNRSVRRTAIVSEEFQLWWWLLR